MKITRMSMTSGVVRTKEIDVTQEQMDDYYKHGKMIEDAFPNLSTEDREFIKTGMTQDDWDDDRS